MHSFGDSFGFRRSDESLFSGAEGEHKVPPTGDFLPGDLVEVDTANDGYIKRSATGTTLVPSIRGILLQYRELIWEPGLRRNVIYNTRDLSEVVPEQHCVIATGAGLKVWVKNLAAQNTAGKRVYSAETRIDLTDLAVGDYVGWDGSKYVKTTTASEYVGVVNKVTTDGAEFTLLK